MKKRKGKVWRRRARDAEGLSAYWMRNSLRLARALSGVRTALGAGPHDDLAETVRLVVEARDRNAADVVEAREACADLDKTLRQAQEWAQTLEHRVRDAECRAVEAEREAAARRRQAEEEEEKA